jgi:alpha-tubulin suppressor-like RCC1 family protein
MKLIVLVALVRALFLLQLSSAETTLYGMGTPLLGELGLGDTNARLVPTIIPNVKNVIQVACGDRFCHTLLNDSNVFSTGWSYV